MAAVDYAKILAAFALGERNPLLKPSTVTTMWTVPALYENIAKVLMPGYTNGWDSWTEPDGLRVVQHGGGIPGYVAKSYTTLMAGASQCSVMAEREILTSILS